ncbi:MAG: transcriptional regulator PpsR [Bradyrhizobiaceae bacterium]|nr:MAG: transcriptional regulator PpsR [Bradyrhizobiaceae bacterium]
MFKSPKESLGDLGAQAAAKLIAAAADVAVVIDGRGVVRDVAFNKDELSLELDGRGRWRGSKLAEIVTAETRSKINELLQDATDGKASAWRQVNHPSSVGVDVPVLYTAVNIGRDDRFVLVGRDLRQLATMQQRLISAQQSMERDYVRLRHAETRYRLLFQVSAEAVMMIDAQTTGIIDVNPAAISLLNQAGPQLIKSSFTSLFDPADVPAIENCLSDIRATGRDGSIRVRLAGNRRACQLAASLFRQERASLLLVRLSDQESASDRAAVSAAALLSSYFDTAPDATVITRDDGTIIKVNGAFLEMAQLSHEEQVRGESLDRWLGRSGVDFGVLLANLKQSGTVKMFATLLRGAFGATVDVEVSAVSVTHSDDKKRFGFAIRNVEKRLSGAIASSPEMPRSIAQLTGMIGRVPLRDLVRETTDVIEKLSIEAALELTGDNRASAAEMLGLSRQSLYVKLRRFGLAEPAAEEGADDE